MKNGLDIFSSPLYVPNSILFVRFLLFVFTGILRSGLILLRQQKLSQRDIRSLHISWVYRERSNKTSLTRLIYLFFSQSLPRRTSYTPLLISIVRTLIGLVYKFLYKFLCKLKQFLYYTLY